MLLDAANMILQHARARAYLGEVVKKEPAGVETNTKDSIDVDENEDVATFWMGTARPSWNSRWLPPGIKPVLEKLSKRHILREVLDEIEQEIHFSEQKQDEISPKNTVLIMTSNAPVLRCVRFFPRWTTAS